MINTVNAWRCDLSQANDFISLINKMTKERWYQGYDIDGVKNELVAKGMNNLSETYWKHILTLLGETYAETSETKIAQKVSEKTIDFSGEIGYTI